MAQQSTLLKTVNPWVTGTKESGCTILLVTHDNRILDIADRIVHMEDGRLAKDTALRA